MAEAGYWAPPDGPDGLSLYQAPSGYPSYGQYPSAAPPQPQPAMATGGQQVRTVSDERANRRLQAADLGAFLGAGAVLGSLFLPWYQFAFSSGGVSVSFSITALTFPAGGAWRWLMLVLSIAIMVEILVTSVLTHADVRFAWPHRAALGLLCAANLTLVIGAMVVSPFSDIATIGVLQASLGAGAYVALTGAVVGAAAAVVRLFSGPPALTR